jgi:hypothetical protein
VQFSKDGAGGVTGSVPFFMGKTMLGCLSGVALRLIQLFDPPIDPILQDGE